MLGYEWFPECVPDTLGLFCVEAKLRSQRWDILGWQWCVTGALGDGHVPGGGGGRLWLQGPGHYVPCGAVGASVSSSRPGRASADPPPRKVTLKVQCSLPCHVLNARWGQHAQVAGALLL